jgi:putative intracellular protease/amidase
VNETHRVVSLHDVVIQTDLTIKDVDEKGVELCVLPGGLKGVDVLMANGMAKKLCRDLAAPRQTAPPPSAADRPHWPATGWLDGYHATVFPAVKDKLCGRSPWIIRGGGPEHHHRQGAGLDHSVRPLVVRQLAGDER